MKHGIAAWLKRCATTFWGLLVSAAVALSATLSGAMIYPLAAVAQESQSQESTTQPSPQAELVDGLLDLLDEPISKAPDPEPGAEIQMEPLGTPGQATSEVPRTGVGGSAARADLPAESSPTSHPLSMVQRGMWSAAERLGRGVVGPETQKLQDDILQQLDSLIEQLERQDSAESASQPRQQSSTAQSQASRMSTEEQSSSAAQASSDDLQPEGGQQSDSGQGAQDRPSQAVAAAEVAVDLADPERLQQDVWGQLPEQMRKQMQSRMVESFLPSYRPQIEAYFRKLLQSEEL